MWAAGHRLHGNTPTGVGKTYVAELRKLGYLETPPRAWGRPQPAPAPVSDDGNTPTGVGKTAPLPPPSWV